MTDVEKEVKVIKSAQIREVSFVTKPDGQIALEVGLTKVEYKGPGITLSQKGFQNGTTS